MRRKGKELEQKKGHNPTRLEEKEHRTKQVHHPRKRKPSEEGKGQHPKKNIYSTGDENGDLILPVKATDCQLYVYFGAAHVGEPPRSEEEY